MVVFTCGHCGESVQKPKVEKHYLTKCRNRSPNLSCMDCFKDFLGKDYETHTKCITEEERYSGKGFQAKEKKGEKKQNAWVEMLQSVLDEQKTAPSNVLRIIEAIGKYNNTPRKKPKFINFVKNVCGPKTNPKDIEQAWDLISVKLADLSKLNQNRNESQKNTPDSNCKTEVDSDDKNIEKNKNETESVDEEKDEDNKVNEENGNIENSEPDIVDQKKLSKKQRKEEKKRKKYEAELQSAVTAPVEPEEEETQTNNKKGKKKKNKSESSNGDGEDIHHEGKNKNKKRKRQDTTNSAPEIHDETENVENVPITKENATKKKLKIDGSEEVDESVCLHDQNVAKIEELSMKSDKFNWHGAIMAVLEKKGEVPFKRLQKKVLYEYSEATGREVDDRIADKFIKKLKSAPNVRVDKNRVLIVE